MIAGALGSVLLDWIGWSSLFQFVGFISLLWCFFLNWLNNLSMNRRRTAYVYGESSSAGPLSSPSKQKAIFDSVSDRELAVFYETNTYIIDT